MVKTQQSYAERDRSDAPIKAPPKTKSGMEIATTNVSFAQVAYNAKMQPLVCATHLTPCDTQSLKELLKS